MNAGMRIRIVALGTLTLTASLTSCQSASEGQTSDVVATFIDAIAQCAGPDGCEDVEFSEFATGDARVAAEQLQQRWEQDPLPVNVDRSFEIISSYSEDGKATDEVCVSWSFNRAWADDRESISTADGEPSGQLWIDDFALDYVDGQWKVAAIGYRRNCRLEPASTTEP